ncbi:uncharacterized protein [Elaeis guineensis]|uniref:uncharacterized protein n=1 Tax=Elaeis guineensis var. tenera TaxID=51953 RepID=UPI003C6CE0D2
MRLGSCFIGVWWLLLFLSCITICSARKLLPILEEDTKAYADNVDGDKSRDTDNIFDYGSFTPTPGVPIPPHSPLEPPAAMEEDHVNYSKPNPSQGLHSRHPKHPIPN